MKTFSWNLGCHRRIHSIFPMIARWSGAISFEYTIGNLRRSHYRNRTRCFDLITRYTKGQVNVLELYRYSRWERGKEGVQVSELDENMSSCWILQMTSKPCIFCLYHIPRYWNWLSSYFQVLLKFGPRTFNIIPCWEVQQWTNKTTY
jgi:hypothetical protein